MVLSLVVFWKRQTANDAIRAQAAKEKAVRDAENNEIKKMEDDLKKEYEEGLKKEKAAQEAYAESIGPTLFTLLPYVTPKLRAPIFVLNAHSDAARCSYGR